MLYYCIYNFIAYIIFFIQLLYIQGFCLFVCFFNDDTWTYIYTFFLFVFEKVKKCFPKNMFQSLKVFLTSNETF